MKTSRFETAAGTNYISLSRPGRTVADEQRSDISYCKPEAVLVFICIEIVITYLDETGNPFQREISTGSDGQTIPYPFRTPLCRLFALIRN